MNEAQFFQGRSFLAGKYTINEIECEINTALSYISLGEFFCQGSDADDIIDQIFAYWYNYDVTQEQAILWYMMTYL